MRRTLQYIYILLNNLPLNVTVAPGWLDNYWIHLFRLTFFSLTSSPLSPVGPGNPLSPFTPCRKAESMREGAEKKRNQLEKGLKLKADGCKLQNVSSSLTAHDLKLPGLFHCGTKRYPWQQLLQRAHSRVQNNICTCVTAG